MQLIFATNNENKIKEVKSLFAGELEIVSLKEAGINKDIAEPHLTLEENAREKSSVIYQLTNANCFSEDTGLEVAALEGKPGVHSSRYAGDKATGEDNINLLLHNLKNKSDRSARFRTVISLIIDGKEFLFEGICNGSILHKKKGDKGFGYDPVFVPDGSQHSFAEMDLDEKNEFSHRRKAFDNLVTFIYNYKK